VGPSFQLRADPWWVNLLWLVPFLAFAAWQRKRLQLSKTQLAITAIFALAFGYVEAGVVVYLRAAVGLLPGYHGTLADVQRMSNVAYQQSQSLNDVPQSLLTLEVFREGATIVMLLVVALLAAHRARERCAVFLWAFAVWDASYYGWLWLTVRWPSSLKEMDILFLIPKPWIAQVWLPLAVSALSALAVLLGRRDSRRLLRRHPLPQSQ
jgi:hypothetical protein